MKISFWVYYKKRTILNADRGKFAGPVIVISNHPATLMDPLNVGIEIPRRLHFLANASLFKNAFGNWFFNTFYCIPVERYKDTGGKALNNANAFRRAAQHLSGGNILFMAPEGSSETERHLRRIKTGCARIAISTEKANDYQLGLRILPVGLTYDDGRKFRDNVVVNFGKMIDVAPYQPASEDDEIKAVRALTVTIEDRLSGLIVNASDRQEDLLLKKMETIYFNEHPTNKKERFFKSQQLLTRYHQQLDTGKTVAANWQIRLSNYFDEIKKHNTSDAAIKNGRIQWALLPLLILGFPLFVFGALNHLLPTLLPAILDSKYTSDSSFSPTVKSLSGLVSFLIFYPLQIWAIHKLIGHEWFTIVYAILLLPSGLFAEWYADTWQHFMASLNALKMDQAIRDQLLDERKQILKKLKIE